MSETTNDLAGELREQVAEWLCERVVARDRVVHAHWPDLPEPTRAGWLEWADALLSGPLAPLLAKLQAKSSDAALAATTQATVSVLTRHTTGCACDTCEQLRFVRLPDVVVMTPDPAADEIRRALGA